jgi:predicted ATP-dependent serine protease
VEVSPRRYPIDYWNIDDRSKNLSEKQKIAANAKRSHVFRTGIVRGGVMVTGATGNGKTQLGMNFVHQKRQAAEGALGTNIG